MTEVDADTQTMRCTICGDEVPIPLGAPSWAGAVFRAFAQAHPKTAHDGKRTYFATPPPPAKDEEQA